jgi:hypothetical protein
VLYQNTFTEMRLPGFVVGQIPSFGSTTASASVPYQVDAAGQGSRNAVSEPRVRAQFSFARAGQTWVTTSVVRTSVESFGRIIAPLNVRVHGQGRAWHESVTDIRTPTYLIII